MSNTREFDVGDVAVVPARFLVDGTLVSPAALYVLVRRPDGVTLNSTDHPAQVVVTIGGVNLIPTELLAEFTPPITPAENTAGTGLALVQVVTAIQNESTDKAHGDWWVGIHNDSGAARGAPADQLVRVRRPKVPYQYTASTIV